MHNLIKPVSTFVTKLVYVNIDRVNYNNLSHTDHDKSIHLVIHMCKNCPANAETNIRDRYVNPPAPYSVSTVDIYL